MNKGKKGRIVRRAKRSYRRSDVVPRVQRKQVDFLADVALCMKMKRRFFAKLTNIEYAKLVQLGAQLYTVGFEAAGGEVK